jgi:hypothetical protein
MAQRAGDSLSGGKGSTITLLITALGLIVVIPGKDHHSLINQVLQV